MKIASTDTSVGGSCVRTNTSAWGCAEDFVHVGVLCVATIVTGPGVTSTISSVGTASSPSPVSYHSILVASDTKHTEHIVNTECSSKIHELVIVD